MCFYFGVYYLDTVYIFNTYKLFLIYKNGVSMDLKKSFGARLKELRKIKKMTQFELAEKVGIDEKHLSHIETGRSFPKAVLIERLAQILGVNLDEMFNFNSQLTREQILTTPKNQNSCRYTHFHKTAQVGYELAKS